MHSIYDEVNFIPSGSASFMTPPLGEFSEISTIIKKETKQKKKMDKVTVVYSKPYVFDTTLGQYSVQFIYEPQREVYLGKSDKPVVRDVTSARLVNCPYDASTDLFINSHGYTVRRPNENNNKTAARLYALANAVIHGYDSNTRRRSVLFGYLKSLGLNSEICSLIIGEMRVL